MIRGIPSLRTGGSPEDPEDEVMTVTAEGVDIPLTSRPRSRLGRLNPIKLPGRMVRSLLGGLGGLGGYEFLRDRLARGIENADLGPLRVLGILPESLRESMANVFDESTLVADDLPGHVHDFAELIAAKAIMDAGGNIPDSGVHVPYPTQGFAAEHFQPAIQDRMLGKLLGTDMDAESMSRDEFNEAMGFMDPSGWGATFGQGTLFEDPEGNIHLIDRYNFPNMTAGQVPGREKDTSRQFSDYARGLGEHDSEQFRADIKAFLTDENRSKAQRFKNVLRHYASEFGSTEDDPTEGRSWDINLGPRDELLARYAQATDPDKQNLLERGLAFLGNLRSRERASSPAQVAQRTVLIPEAPEVVSALEPSMADIEFDNYQNGGIVPLRDRPIFGQRPKKLWDAVQRFLNPETPAETAAVVGTSMIEPAGTIMDATDLYIGLRDRDLPRAGAAGAGLLLPMVSGRLMREGGSRAVDAMEDAINRGDLDAINDAIDKLPPPPSDLVLPDANELLRLNRRNQWLEPSEVQGPVYHGTTHVFDEFDPRMGNPESHHGASSYFSSSPTDVQTNYARIDGPDVTQRIELEQERLMNLEDLDEATALSSARTRILGEHQGATVPANIRLENPVDTRPDGTVFKFEEYFDDELGRVEEGELFDIIDAMNKVGGDLGVDTGPAVRELAITALDEGGISAYDLERIMRGDLGDQFFDAIDPATDEALGGVGEFLRRVYKEAGYDGTIVDAEATFGPRMMELFDRRPGGPIRVPVAGMPGVEGATHYAVFDPRNIRSPFARFDPSRRDSADLLAGLAGLLATGSMRGRDRDNYVER